MNLDWTILLPIVNSTGIPLLAIGIILLLRAYQKSGETYKETSNHLKEENERLRKRLNDADTLYISEVEKMRTAAVSAAETIKELQARKIALLSSANEANKESALHDVDKINKAIEELHTLSSVLRSIDSKIRESLFYINHDFRYLTINISNLADQIGDTKSRVAIVSAITSTTSLKELVGEIEKQKDGRGLIAPAYVRKKRSITNKETQLTIDRLKEEGNDDDDEGVVLDKETETKQLSQENKNS